MADHAELLLEARDLVRYGRLGSGQKSIIRDLISLVEMQDAQLRSARAMVIDYLNDPGADEIDALRDIAETLKEGP